jgi:molybdenum cofactor biosynthesis protein B
MAVHEHRQKSKKAVGCFVITVSDTRDESSDQSGQLIKTLLSEHGHAAAGYRIVKDETAQLKPLLEQTLADHSVEVILLNGGTGIAPRDTTYEVVSSFLEKKLEGFGEIFRYLSYQEIGSAAIMSRAVAGVARGKIVVSLPGSKAAVELAMRRLILPELGHMVSQVQGR